MLIREELTRGPGTPLQSRGSSLTQLGPGCWEAGASVHVQSLQRKLSIYLEKYATVFQSEVYPILACPYEIQNKDGQEKCVSIISDSQAALKAPQAEKNNVPFSATVPKRFDRHIHPPFLGTLLGPKHSGICRNETGNAGDVSRGGNLGLCFV